jgi:cholesterol oxidase
MVNAADPLANPAEDLQSEYDVIVVGSGYGGAITAARLGVANASAGGALRIAVLERGAEYPTGTFPESQQDAALSIRSAVTPLGLLEIDHNPTVDILRGNGLGGTSLVNFNVAIEPDREVFLASWPRPIRELVDQDPNGLGGLDEYFGRARRMLGANRFIDGENLARVDVFGRIAKEAGAQVVPLNITVNKQDRVSRYGVVRKACPMHGGDGTGDNTFSKNTVATNYLPMAKHFGVEIFTQIEVERVEQTTDGKWRIIGKRRSGTRGLTTTDVTVTARRVVLAAGAMGTNGILLRSQSAGLKLSKRLGKNFSGNGDNFGIAYNTNYRTDTQAWASTDGPPRSELMCGPSITMAMRFGAGQADLRKRFTVEDLSIPRALQDVFRVGLMALAATRYPSLDRAKVNRWRKDAAFNTDGAMNHSLGFLIMVHDNSDGEIVLRNDGSVTIDWPGAPTERMYKDVDDILRPAVEAIGGTYIKNPWWTNSFFGNQLLSAHPMGGCTTADDIDGGVVDHAGKVFHPDGGVYDGLYVSDGSVVPRAIGVNPFLTISMFAERSAEVMREELGLPGYDPATEADDY